MATVPLSVAIYNDGGVYKHWSLFVEGPAEEEKLIFHVMGSSTRYRYEKRQSDARNSARLYKLVPICRIDKSNITAIETAAENAVIANDEPGYNCQDYILELLDTLAEEGIVDSKSKEYQKNRKTLQSMVEGLA